MPRPAPRRLSFPEYLAQEAHSDVKHEWLDGQVVAMAGGSPVHALLQMRAGLALMTALGRGPCRTYSSDLMVRVRATGLATYPDVTVICGAVEADPEHRHAATNPALLVEVLSPSTEGWDRDEKFAHYQQLSSLRHYLLVHQDRQCVEVYGRRPDGSWAYRCFGPGQRVPLSDLTGDANSALDVDLLYDGTDVPVRAIPPFRVAEPEVGWAAQG